MSRAPLIVKRKDAAYTITKVDNVDNTLNTALRAITEQVEKLALMSKQATFTEKESKVLNDYVKTLLAMQKNERENERSDALMNELSKLSDQELLDLAQKKISENKA